MQSALKIVSGGQTGVDRAALDAALDAGLPIGGWCPRGRRAEDGAIDSKYPLLGTPDEEYLTRTDWNVRDSDGTLVLCRGEPSGGTLRTIRRARDKYHRPLLIVDLDTHRDVTAPADWVIAKRIVVLNIAGPRESTSPGIYNEAREYLRAFFALAIPTLKASESAAPTEGASE